MANKFKNPVLRSTYDGYMAAARAGHLRNPDGTPSRGGSGRCSFWSGFDGGPRPVWIPSDSQNYAAYRAGQDYAKESLTN